MARVRHKMTLYSSDLLLWLGPRTHGRYSNPGAKGCRPLDNTEIKARIIALRQEHRDLDGAIDALVEKAAFDQLQLQRMKKRKLALRDLIGRLEARLVPDIIA